MEISGTLHLYSGKARELFFVFDDDVAQELYDDPAFDFDDRDTRRVYISVGADRLIHRRTLNFSRKQTEIKVSLCSKNTSSGLGALSDLYDWYVPSGQQHPAPFAVIGKLQKVSASGETGWELLINEAVEDG